MSSCCGTKEVSSAFVYTNGIPPRRLFDQATSYLDLEEGPLIKVRLPQRPRTLMHILFTPEAIQLRESHGLRFEDYDPRAIPFKQDSVIHLSIDESCPGLTKTFVLKFLPDFENAIRPFLRTLKPGHLASFGVLFPNKVAKKLKLWDDVPYMQVLDDTRRKKGKGKATGHRPSQDQSENSSIDVFADTSMKPHSMGQDGSSNVLWVEPRPEPNLADDLERPSTTRLVRGKQGVAEKGIFTSRWGEPVSKSRVQVRAIGIGAVIEKGEKEDDLAQIWFCHGPFLLL